MKRRANEEEGQLESVSPEELDLCTEVGSENGAVLLSDEIKAYVERYNMIDPFEPRNLKPAGCELTLGEDYAIGGKLRKLYPEPGKDELVIPPFEVVIISTKEKINLPQCIIARWNLRVRWVYEGLLWTGALQVDPGWSGILYCPIYNLSSKDVVLTLGKPVVLMDFVKTTPFKEGESLTYPHPPKRKDLSDYNWKLESALYTEAAQRINGFNDRINKFEKRIDAEVRGFGRRLDYSTGGFLTFIAIMVAVLSILLTTPIFVTSAPQVTYPSPIWILFSNFISLFALSMAIYTWSRIEGKSWKQTFALIAVVFGVILALGIIWQLKLLI